MAKRRLAVSAVVINSRHEVLLVKQGRSRHHWELPGGKVKKPELLTDAMIREVKEECAIGVRPLRLQAIYFIPEEGFYDFVFVSEPKKEGPQPRPNPPEIEACGYFRLDGLPEPMQQFTRSCIRDAVAGKTHALPMRIRSSEWLD